MPCLSNVEIANSHCHVPSIQNKYFNNSDISTVETNVQFIVPVEEMELSNQNNGHHTKYFPFYKQGGKKAFTVG